MHSEEGRKARIKINFTCKKFRKHFSKITKKIILDYFQNQKNVLDNFQNNKTGKQPGKCGM